MGAPPTTKCDGCRTHNKRPREMAPPGDGIPASHGCRTSHGHHAVAALAGLAGGPPRAVPSDAVVAAASRVLPADLVQKLLLLSIFVLACSGAAALLAREPWYARLAAGVFYTWNPFVAERLIIGQWALLLGYAGLPWAL